MTMLDVRGLWTGTPRPLCARNPKIEIIHIGLFGRIREQLNSGARGDVPRASQELTCAIYTYTKHTRTHDGQKLPTSSSLTRYAPDLSPAARTRRAPAEHLNRVAARDSTATVAHALHWGTSTRTAEAAPPGGHDETHEHAQSGLQTTQRETPQKQRSAALEEHSTAARRRRRWRWRRGGIEDGGESAGRCGDGVGASAEGECDAGDGEAVRGSWRRWKGSADRGWAGGGGGGGGRAAEAAEAAALLDLSKRKVHHRRVWPRTRQMSSGVTLCAHPAGRRYDVEQK